MGELAPGQKMNHDAQIMPWISSCNIACGFHSGSPELIERSIKLAIENNVAIGAHPSYNDPENFGRKSIEVPMDILMSQIRYQVSALKGMAESLGSKLNHVKAHGALYNDMIHNQTLSLSFAQLVKSIDPQLAILGFANSALADICKDFNIRFIHEVFADRSYENAKQLRSRNLDNALILDTKSVLKQVKGFLQNEVKDHSGTQHFINAESICLHSDTERAVKLANEIHQYLKNNNVKICPA